RATLSRDDRPRPLEEDAEAQARLCEREDVDERPGKPGDERLEAHLPALEDREARTDHGHRAAVGVPERLPGVLQEHAPADGLPAGTAVLQRPRRASRERLALWDERGGATDHVDLGAPGPGEIRLDLPPPRAVGLDRQPLAGCRGNHAGSPDDRLGGDALPG